MSIKKRNIITDSLHFGAGIQKGVNEKAEDVKDSKHLGVGTQRVCL